MRDGGGGRDTGRSAGGRTGRGPERESGTGGGGSAPLVCELCGGPVLDRHCKIVCLNCGYQRDCSDP